MTSAWQSIDVPNVDFGDCEMETVTSTAMVVEETNEFGLVLDGRGVLMRVNTFEDATCLAAVFLRMALNLAKTPSETARLDTMVDQFEKATGGGGAA